MKFVFWIILVFVTWNYSYIQKITACPPGCTCTTLKPKDGKGGDSPRIGRGRKVNCVNNHPPISTVSQINSIPLDTVILDLSKNAITILRKGGFDRLSMLKKLDLSHNQITRIEPGAFEGLPNLEKLDLSNNNIGSINSSMFSGMPKLQRLSLSNNKINTIPAGTFRELNSLRKIDFKSAYLRCDCHLQWIAKWSRDKNVRIQSSTTCAVPRELKDKTLKSLKKKDLHCDRPLELPLFEIKPSHNQVVFEGDKLPFTCRATIIDDDTRMVWIRKEEIVQTNRSLGILVFNRKTPDKIMVHQLVLENLMEDDTGIWECKVTTPQGNVSSKINIVVIPNTAAYCSSVRSMTNKGVYKWPKTVAGVKSEQPCKRGSDRMATHYCTAEGRWEKLNVDRCEFISDVTRKLQDIAETKGNDTFSPEKANDLFNLVSKPSSITDPTDLMYASKAISDLTRQIQWIKGLSDRFLHIIGSIMKVKPDVLLKGQKSDKACTRLVHVVESIPSRIKEATKKTELSKHSDNIALEAMEQPILDFPGMTCFAYATNIFSCQGGIINQSAPIITKQQNLRASVQLPKTLFNGSITQNDDQGTTIGLQFIFYKGPQLFPITTSQHDDPHLNSENLKVVSSVLSVNVSRPVFNLTEPVILTFKVQNSSRHLVAGFWDFDANNGFGDWRTDGCKIVAIENNTTVIHCYHLSIFAVLENSLSGLNGQGLEAERMLELMEIPVYLGSCVCLLCLMAVIITYVSCFRFINVPKKMKHSVINICISVLLLLIAFTMGVKRIDHKLACQIVGVSIHYLTLCTIFWITITSYNMLKKFTKSDRPASPPPEDTPMPLPPKPMLRFYLLGWGVPIIVCGITAAVSIDHYAEPNYCFLAWDPSLGAFYIPVALLVVFNLTFFLRISCVVRGTPNNLNESDDTEEVNDIELTPNPDDTNAEIQALTQSRNNPEHQSSESIASSVMDQERRPITQLYALVAMLFLFIVFWVCGALAVAEPFKSIIPHQETIFSYLYGISCGVFGIFMLAYFCITRKDSCTSWKRFFCCDQQPVYDVDFHVNNHANIPNGHAVPVKNEIECENNKNYNITHELSSNGSQKQSNLTLVPPAPTSDVSLSGGSEKIPNFYNPRQNGIAKKFWEKQKKHSRIITRDMVKDYNESGTDLNFSGSEANRTYNCGSTSDGNNTHLSIEIQIQPNSQENHQEGNSTRFTGMQGPVGLVNITPNGIPGHKPMFSMLPLERNHIPPVGGSGSPDPTNDSTCCSTVSYSDSSVVPQHIRSPSACSLGMRNHLSAFTPVAPRNNTLPKQSKVNSPSNVSSPTNNYMLRNGSVPRMRDFDGQSQVSDQCPKEQQTRIPPQISYVLPDNGYHRVGAMVNAQPDNAYHRVGGMVNSPKPEDGCTYKQYGSVDDHITCEAPPPDYHQVIRTRSPSGGGGGYSSDASGRQNRSRRKDNNSFIQEVHQRIPNEQNVSTNHSAASPLTPDTQPPHHRKLFTPDSDSQIHYKRNRCNDSDHNSEPTSSVSHRHRHKNRDSHHKHSKHRLPKQRSLEWDSPAKDKRKVIPYAYVNHSYQDRIRQKLQQNPNMSMTDKDGWPLPRSSSNSEKISKQELSRMMEDSSSTSSDDDDAFGNVWVPQKKDKSKKETSV